MDDLRKPILPGKGASDYERYLRTDELLSLQKLPEKFLHKDELTFQVVHQASELLLKGAAWELERSRESHARVSDFVVACARDHHSLRLPSHPRWIRTRKRAGFSRLSSAAAHWSPVGRGISRGVAQGECNRRRRLPAPRRIIWAARCRRTPAGFRRTRSPVSLPSSETGAKNHWRRSSGYDGHASRGPPSAHGASFL